MPYTPVVKTQLQLQTEVDNLIKANANNEITGPIMGQLLSDIIASVINKIDNINLLGLSNYDVNRAYKGGATGDCTIKDNQILQCVTDTQGVFDSTKWKIIAGVEIITQANLIAKRNAGTLLSTVLYFISDKSIFIGASGASRLNQSGLKIYRTPRYEELNPASHIITVWGLPEATDIVVGQWVAFSNEVYQRNSLTNNSDSPIDNVADYTLIASNNNNAYKDFPVLITYEIDLDIISFAADSYGNRISMSKESRDALGIGGGDIAWRWGDPLCFGNTGNEAYAEILSSPIAVQQNVLHPGAILQSNINSSRTASFVKNTVHQGANVVGNTMEADTTISNSNFLQGADFRNKTLPATYQINNFTMNIAWADMLTLSVDLDNKTMTYALNNVVATLDIDGLITSPATDVYRLNIASVWWAGIINLTSGTATPAGIINRFTDLTGTWPYKFKADMAGLCEFEGNDTQPVALLFFDPTDNKAPFADGVKGFIIFEKIAANTWICLQSKSIV